MKTKLEQLQIELSNTEGEERLDLLVEINEVLQKEYHPETERYIKMGLKLAEEFKDDQ